MIVRPAEPDDVAAIQEIYNAVIADSTAIYADAPVSLEDRQRWFADRRAQGYPVLVATDADHGILGFAAFGDWRGAWPGYRYTVEHSVHVGAGQRGKGVGRALLGALLPIAAALGKHVMLGGIDAANVASIRFHQGLGFETVAHFREVGFKFGRRLDLLFMQRFIEPPAPPAASRQAR